MAPSASWQGGKSYDAIRARSDFGFPANGGIINQRPSEGKTDAGKQIADIFSGW